MSAIVVRRRRAAEDEPSRRHRRFDGMTAPLCDLAVGTKSDRALFFLALLYFSRVYDPRELEKGRR